MRERRGFVQFALERGIDPAGIIVRLGIRAPGEQIFGSLPDMGASRAAPSEYIGLRSLHVPSLHKVIHPRVSDVARTSVAIALQGQMPDTGRIEVPWSIKQLHFFHRA